MRREGPALVELREATAALTAATDKVELLRRDLAPIAPKVSPIRWFASALGVAALGIAIVLLSALGSAEQPLTPAPLFNGGAELLVRQPAAAVHAVDSYRRVEVFQYWDSASGSTHITLAFPALDAARPFSLRLIGAARLAEVKAQAEQTGGTPRELHVTLRNIACSGSPAFSDLAPCQSLEGFVPAGNDPAISIDAHVVESIAVPSDWAHEWLVIPSWDSLFAAIPPPSADAVWVQTRVTPDLSVDWDNQTWRFTTATPAGSTGAGTWALGANEYDGTALLTRRDATLRANLWLGVGGTLLGAAVTLALQGLSAMRKLAARRAYKVDAW